MRRKIFMVLYMACALVAGGCSAESAIEPDEMFSDRDFETEYDAGKSASITLTGSGAQSSSGGVEINGSIVTIKDEGTYILSGSLDDGMVIVDGHKEEKIQLVLDGVNIHSKTSAPICILQSDKVFITLAEGSENSLSNGGTFTAIDENEIDAVIFSKEDVTINGEGALNISSPGGHGIVSKDELTITGGVFDITCASHALSGKDGIGIAGGSFQLTSGKDGVHADGSIVVNGGIFAIATEDDGFHADETLSITGGTIDISTSYEGLEALDLVISGGEISLVASDDGLNAAGGMDSSGFGGMGGNDMFGKPGGKRGEGKPGGMQGGTGNSFHKGSITISGGNLYINASGDGIDANGTLTISGGYTVVCGPTRGDTATLDYDISATITGGTFLGTGALGMAQTFSDSAQGVIAVNTGNSAAGTLLTLTDKNGNDVITHTPELDFSVVILSCPDMVSGETYTLTVGSATAEFTAE